MAEIDLYLGAPFIGLGTDLLPFNPNLQRLLSKAMSALNFGTKTRRFRHAFPLLVAVAAMALPSGSSAQAVDVTVAIAPPELPVYDQPEIPGPDYIWTPGFWAYGPEGYYWVPGTWVQPPAVGLLWTPGYWGWHDGVYVFNRGYWGPHVGFYGGINYGFGYGGSGYEGGYWKGGVFAYNTTVNNFGSVHITNVYKGLPRDRRLRNRPRRASSTFRRPPRRCSTFKPPVRIARCSHPSTMANPPLRPHPSQVIFPGTGWSGPKTSGREDLEAHVDRVGLAGRARPPRKAG